MSEITTYNSNLINQLSNDPLFVVVENYINSVKTPNGIAPSKDQKENFILTCLINKLNPSKKQIYLLGYDSYKNGATFNEIISITGQTSIASRTGEYAGLTQPRFTYSGDQLDSCSVSVIRLVQGQKCEFFGQSYFSERAYDKHGNLTVTFTKQPKTMLEKCARAVALRNAFPEELGNTYEEAETSTMVETKPTAIVKTKPAPIVKIELKTISPEQEAIIYKTIQQMAKIKKLEPAVILDHLLLTNNLDDIKTMTEPLASKLVLALELKLTELQKTTI